MLSGKNINRFMSVGNFFFIIILLSYGTAVFAYCSGRGDCCRCPGQAQDLGSYSSCEEACGLKKGSGSGSYGSGQGIGTIIGTELGKEINKALWGDPAEEARRKEEARINEQNRLRHEQENNQRLEAQKDRIMEGMMDKESTSTSLGLMTDDSDSNLKLMDGEPERVEQKEKKCGIGTFNVSNSLQKFDLEARKKAYTFLAKDVVNEVVTKESLEGMKAQDYKEFHDKTKKTVERVNSFSEELAKIEACLGFKSCNLTELNKKINEELAEWLKVPLKDGTKNAIDRVKDAKEFLKGYARRIGVANEKAMKESTTCQDK